VASQVAPVREVLLSMPGPEMAFAEDPDAWLMMDRPDPALFAVQAESLARAYEAQGVVVHRVRPEPARPNHVFACDLFWMTPEGAVLARMASEQRAGEERALAACLAALGVPILLTPRGEACFEGADAAWLDARTVLIGLGLRTNREAVRQLEALLSTMGVRVLAADIGPGFQHLLGAINWLDEDLVVALGPQTAALTEALAGREVVELPRDEETVDRRGMNFVTLGPRRVLMPSGCPRTRERLERLGVACVEAQVTEYIKAAGAIGCATGVLWRA
jgi:N-dimethylarginine dimethylaminohydrolase